MISINSNGKLKVCSSSGILGTSNIDCYHSDKICLNDDKYEEEMVKHVIESLLDSSNPDVQENVNIILKYLISKIEPVLKLDKPLEEYIKECINSEFSYTEIDGYSNYKVTKNAKEDLISILKDREIIKLEQENISLREELNMLKNKISNIEAKLNQN